MGWWRGEEVWYDDEGNDGRPSDAPAAGVGVARVVLCGEGANDGGCSGWGGCGDGDGSEFWSCSKKALYAIWDEMRWHGQKAKERTGEGQLDAVHSLPFFLWDTGLRR